MPRNDETIGLPGPGDPTAGEWDSSRRSPSPVICIAGMHRSGSSLVAGIVERLGLDLGPAETLLTATSDNPDGYWEHVGFQQLNDDLLLTLGGGWDFPLELPADWSDSGFESLRGRADALVAAFPPDRAWGWKDPRNSLTLPFWQQAIPHLSVVVVVRNPLDVAASLRRRNGTSLAAGLALWQAYYRGLLATTSPSNRIVTHYDAYFADVEREARRLGAFAGLPVRDETVARCRDLVAHDLRHSRSSNHLLIEAGVADDLVQLYMALSDEAGWRDHGPEDPAEGTARDTAHAPIPATPPNDMSGALVSAFVAAQDGIVHRQQRQIADLSERLATMQASPILSLALRLRRARHRLVPPGSVAARLLSTGTRVARPSVRRNRKETST